MSRIRSSSSSKRSGTPGRDRRVLQPLVVQRESLDQILTQPLGGPAAELGAARRAYAVADSQDGVEVVVVDVAADLPGSLLANY